MQKVIKCKNGFVKINTENPDWAFLLHPANPLFKAVEKYFNSWLDKHQGRDIHSMYLGSFEEMDGGSYLDKRGAIEAGVEAVVEYMAEKNQRVFTTHCLWEVDLEGVFQD